VPHRAELAVGAIVAVISAAADVRSAIGFSSFAVLTYYAIRQRGGLDAAPRPSAAGPRAWSAVRSGRMPGPGGDTSARGR